jgi:hypothetical protein
MDTSNAPYSGWKTAQSVVVLALLPLFVAWGLGVVHPWLDELSRYSVMLAALPAVCGSAGVLILAALCGLSIALRKRVDLSSRSLRGLSELFGLLGALSLSCSVLAMTRPGGWVVCFALLASVCGETDGSARKLRLPFVLRHSAGVVCWFLAGRIQPFSTGLLRDDLQGSLESLVEAIPSGVSQIVLALLVAGLIVLGGWGSRLPWRWLVGGAVAALGLEHAFAESLDGFLSLALIGSFAAALPQRLARRQGLLVPVLFVLLVSSLLAVRLGLTERWDCRSLDGEGGARLLAEGDYQGIALVPDNMPFLVVLAEGGRSLTRLSPGGGGVSESRLLDHPGGQLVSPPAGTKMVGRLVQSVDELRVEWWDVFTLERSAVKTLPVNCDPGLSFMEPGGARQWIACRASGEVLVVDPRPEGPLTRWDLGSGILGVQRLIGGVLIDREGADSRAGIYEDQGQGLAELQLGPHSTGMVSVSEFGEAFSVGRGPAGHVELRGRAPAVEYQYPLDLDTREGALEALGTRFDSVRVGHWPGRPLWIEGERSIYVSSPIDARIWRVDLEVSWHQTSVRVGTVPRQVVVDSPSQTLFGVNRCGVFEARIKSTFPWRDVPGPPTPPAAVESAS